MAALLIGALGFVAGRSNQPTATTGATEAQVQVTAPSKTDVPPIAGTSAEPVEAVAKVLSPAVVQIETDQGLGSGFIYDTDGHILTAYHVVSGSQQVQVRTAEGDPVTGKVVGSDPESDVAVVKIDGRKDLPVAQLATGEKVQVGQMAVAIGSPFGLDQTVTSGIVSAVGRSMNTPGGAIPMIQTDAPINPGNSGGALADRQGRVIGINDSIESDSGVNAGVGFAIPVDTAKTVADRIVSGKSARTAVLGVSASDPSNADGALVVGITAGSPAAKAGLAKGDVVIALDDRVINSSVDLTATVRSHQPGDDITLKVKRNGQKHDVKVTLGGK